VASRATAERRMAPRLSDGVLTRSGPNHRRATCRGCPCCPGREPIGSGGVQRGLTRVRQPHPARTSAASACVPASERRATPIMRRRRWGWKCAGPPAASDDPFRTSQPENGRGFALTGRVSRRARDSAPARDGLSAARAATSGRRRSRWRAVAFRDSPPAQPGVRWRRRCRRRRRFAGPSA
jgi:hypothetical protein